MRSTQGCHNNDIRTGVINIQEQPFVWASQLVLMTGVSGIRGEEEGGCGVSSDSVRGRKLEQE
jgi:hypothetical protein